MSNKVRIVKSSDELGQPAAPLPPPAPAQKPTPEPTLPPANPRTPSGYGDAERKKIRPEF